jgi:N-acetyl-anhydromuramyl-L-alanine amidase AmpD
MLGTSAVAGTHPEIKDRLMPLNVSTTRPTNAVIDTVVLHFSSDCVQHPDHPYDVERQIEIYRNAKVSTHYLIDRDGNIYRLVNEDRVAWHAGRGALAWDPNRRAMNNASIGIEMLAIGSQSDMVPLFMSKEKYEAMRQKHPENIGYTDAEYSALNRLLDDILARHPQIKRDRFHIIGHEEWAGRARRTDPGELFDFTKIGLTKSRPTTQSAQGKKP